MAKILANRLHHTAYVTKDLEKTRAFYEDLLGLPARGDLLREGRAVGQGAHLLPLLLRDGATAVRSPSSSSRRTRIEALFGPAMPDTPFHHIALHVDAEESGRVRAPHSGGAASSRPTPTRWSMAIAARSM